MRTELHKVQKIILRADLPQALEKIHREKKSIVLAGGCFDIFHYGHLMFLTEASKHGDTLIILLEPDEFIKIKKEKSPVHNQMQRAEILASLEIVDCVILLQQHLKTYDEYLAVVKNIQPKIIAVTQGDSHIELKQKQAEEIGAEVKEVTLPVGEFSSSAIRKLYETFPGH